MEALQMYETTTLDKFTSVDKKQIKKNKIKNMGSKCGTNRLHWLEKAVKDQIPNDLPLFKRRHVPDQEVSKHCKRGGENDPENRWVDTGW